MSLFMHIDLIKIKCGKTGNNCYRLRQNLFHHDLKVLYYEQMACYTIRNHYH